MIYGECGEIVLFRDGKAVNDGRQSLIIVDVFYLPPQAKPSKDR